jgi:hypothetical protein
MRLDTKNKREDEPMIPRNIGFSFAAGLLFLACVGSGVAQPREGFLGKQLSDIQKGSFFDWFNLEQTESSPKIGGGRIVSFRPSGPRFHDLTLLEVATDDNGIIHRMDLVLSRSFIASPKDAPFAADITTSFLGNALAESDAQQMGMFADEIRYRDGTSQSVLVAPGHQSPDLPKTASAAYETYRGTRASYQHAFARTALYLLNEHRTGGDNLRIALAER